MADSTFSVQQLIADDTFLAYVLRTDAASIEHWETWLVQHPEHRVVIEEATQLIHRMAMKQAPLADSVIEAEALKMEARLKTLSSTPSPFQQPVHRRLGWQTWQRVAASLVLLLITAAVGWLLVSRSAETLSYQTAANESKMILLPDSSIVVLGENSRLRYDDNWQAQAQREVWLEGDAYFHVKPKPFVPGGVKFQVHASQATVEVLGTRFSVWNRNAQPRVVLNSGKVKIKVDDNPSVEPILMQPGEMVEMTASGSALAKTKVDIRQYPPQKGSKIVFDQTPIREVLLVIEEYYGLKVHLQNQSMADLKITGTLPTNNKTSFLKALSVTLNIDIVKQSENQLLFKYHP